MPMGETFLRPNRQTGPERVFFPAAERSAPQEVIMKSLLFINNSIDSLQIYYGHFFLFVFPAPARAVAKNLTCKPRKARLMALRLKSRGIQQRRLTL